MQAPICKLGYPYSQLGDIFSPELKKEFFSWMRGQTFTECNGYQYDHEASTYEPSGCGPHGWVYYTSDVQRFLEGKPVID